jgi:hypothetical protein
MLEVNGFCARWNPPDALEIIVAIAEGQQSMEYFAEWLVLEACAEASEPDLERDTAHIERLIVEHRWLLNELAGR